MSLIFIISMTISGNGFADTPTNTAFCVTVDHQTEGGTFVEGGNGSFSAELRVSDAELLYACLTFELDTYSTICDEPTALYLYSGYFDPNGVFT